MDIDSLINQSGAEVLIWVRKNLDVAKDFNWALLAEVSSAKASFDGAGNKLSTIDTDWLRVGIEIYDYLASHDKDERVSSYFHNSMNIRVTLVLNVCDEKIKEKELHIIEQWFINSLPYSYDEVLLLKDSWKNNIDVMRNLRNIKSNIHILKRLDDSGVSFLNPNIRDWINIMGSLP